MFLRFYVLYKYKMNQEFILGKNVKASEYNIVVSGVEKDAVNAAFSFMLSL